MNNLNLIVFCVGLLVSILVVYGVFTQVVAEMSNALDTDHQSGEADCVGTS
jgi:hypothetical protein